VTCRPAMRVTSVYSDWMVGKESPWGWMTVGFLTGLFGVMVLVLWDGPTAAIAGVACCALGGTVTFVSGVAAGVANGMARHEHLQRRR
jgi:drug/metabolite transporter (DMT)-like permease